MVYDIVLFYILGDSKLLNHNGVFDKSIVLLYFGMGFVVLKIYKRCKNVEKNSGFFV